MKGDSNTANDLGCRWSRPGDRVFGVQDLLQPEKIWVCIRRGERRGVTGEECEGA